jgi:hypothetical protein
MANNLPRAQQEVRPNPDPSVMTTAQLDRTIVGLTENMSARFDAITTRLDGMDKATQILHGDLVRFPTILDREISCARDLLESKMKRISDVAIEKFARVDVLFVEGDKRTQQLSTANALALAAALQAAKEAVAEQNRSNTTAIAKSETAVSEQIKQMQVTFETGLRSTNEKIDDIKSRLDKGEGGSIGSSGARTEYRLDRGMFIQTATVAVAVSVGVIALIELLMRHA